MATYNSITYNGGEYNFTFHLISPAESISITDDIAKSMSVTRTDSQGLADIIGNGTSLAAMLDTVTIYQKARTGFMYGVAPYDWYMYNLREDEDELLLMAIKALSDSQTLTDNNITYILDYTRLLSDTMTESDSIALMAGPVLVDFMFIQDTLFRIEVTNKALSDTLNIADWLSIKYRPSHELFGD